MVTINNKTYSGNVVASNNETLTVMVFTSDSFQDVLANTLNVNQVIDSETNTAFNVTEALRATVVDNGVYYIVFSRKPTVMQQLEQRIQQQDNAIDDILVMLLEGGNG